jgi:ethanolamine permease
MSLYYLDNSEIHWLKSITSKLSLNYAVEIYKYEKLNPLQRKQRRNLFNKQLKELGNTNHHKRINDISSNSNPISSNSNNNFNEHEEEKQQIFNSPSSTQHNFNNIPNVLVEEDIDTNASPVSHNILPFPTSRSKEHLLNSKENPSEYIPPMQITISPPQLDIPPLTNEFNHSDVCNNIVEIATGAAGENLSPCPAINDNKLHLNNSNSDESEEAVSFPVIHRTVASARKNRADKYNYEDIEANILSIEEQYNSLHSLHIAQKNLLCSATERELLDLLKLLKRKLNNNMKPIELIHTTQLLTNNHTKNSKQGNTIITSVLPRFQEEDNHTALFNIEEYNSNHNELSNIKSENRNKDSSLPRSSAVPSHYKTENSEFWSRRNLSVNAKWYNVASLAICSILSAAYFSWNEGLEAGFGSFTIASVLTGTAYMILTLSLAEMASALPFSGGSYGFTRAFLGPLAGMFVGLCESLEYILTTAVNIIIFSTLCTELTDSSPHYEPLWQLFCYSASLIFHFRGGKLFWNFTLFLLIVDILVLVLYWVGCLSLAHLSFTSNAANPYSNDQHKGFFLGGMDSFLLVLPIALWWYTGIEAVPLACEETVEPRKSIPKAMISSMIIVIIVSFVTLFICSSVAAQDVLLIHADFPLIEGFNQMFRNPGYNSAVLRLLIFPGLFASAYGFIFSYSRQIFALSRSALIPKFLSITNKTTGTPTAAMIFGSVIGMVICLGNLAVESSSYRKIIYNCMLIVALLTYIFQLICFILLRLRYPMLSRGYRSPVGIAGAVLALIVFILCFIALLGWTAKIWISLIPVTIYLTAGLLYYYFYSSHRLVLSPEESFALYMVYSVNAIRKQRQNQSQIRTAQ